MNETPPTQAVSRCSHCKFGLIVTGKGEREFLPAFFRSLTALAGVSFEVVSQIGQLSPVGPQGQQLLNRRGKVIPTRDEELGLHARGFLRGRPCHFLLVLDDVEHARRGQLAEVFLRYRTALDTMLTADEQARASVHFFANMLEAYYFADSQAVNRVMEIELLPDHPTDVEEIKHPKSDLERLAKQAEKVFREKHDGAKIVPQLRLDHILSNPQTCGFLRTMIAWCVRKLIAHCHVWDNTIHTAYQLEQGIRFGMTDQ